MSFFSNGGFDDRFKPSRSPRISDPSTFNNTSYMREPLFSQTASRTSLQNPASAIKDSRNLHRRFTTSHYSSIAQPRRSAFEPTPGDIFAFQPTLSPAEKKKNEYEQLKQKRLERQKRLDFLNQEGHREELELARLSQELGINKNNAGGHQSEPTTPPELQDAGFPTPLSKPNRFSAGNLISPPGIFGGFSKGESSLTSPPTERARAYNALTAAAPSVSHSKNNSDEEEDQHEETLDFNHRSAASLNRNSMPVTRRDLGSNGLPDSNSLGHVNTHRFLFGDEEKPDQLSTTPRPKSFFHQSDKDDFPILLKRDMSGNMQYSTGANTFDLSSAEDSEPPSSQASKRSSLHHSFSSQAFNGLGLNGAAQLNNGDAGAYKVNQAAPTEAFVLPKTANTNRHSLGASTALSAGSKRPGPVVSPPSTMTDDGRSTPKLQSSYSTNDIPTIKNTGNAASQLQNANVTAEQRLHSHNQSLGRIPPGASAFNSKRQSREFSSAGESPDTEQSVSMQSISSVLHGNVSGSQQGTSIGMTGDTIDPSMSTGNQPNLSTTPFNQQGQYSNAGNSVNNQMNAISTAMNSIALGVPAQQWNPTAQQWNSTAAPYANGYSGYNTAQNYANSRFSDYQAQRGGRRGYAVDGGSSANNPPLEHLQGQIYTLCTDQNGCRYLQKQLEQNKDEYTRLVFEEVKDHMADLMTDPFGNYLCQKLLEHTNKDQDTVLIRNASANMFKIALNQHGTRALQKMIEYVVERAQIEMLVDALKDHVTTMIQDLNGNHVIQKCLNRLSAPDIQFIIDAVSANCVAVGTHRHGCCVIQRCVDHATPEQKLQLVNAITGCAYPLVQDPFGNYVLQYIFDQGETSFSQLLCKTFLGHVAELSKQKFSSNVIEKCIRIADDTTKHELIEEIILTPEFERIADDPFANYVVQTAWDNANEEDEARLADRIRPVLGRMRHKPYGRRFQTRITERDRRFGIGTSSQSSEIGSPESASVMQSSYTSPQNGGAYYNPHDSGYGGGAFAVANSQFTPSNISIGSPQVTSPGPAIPADWSRFNTHRFNSPMQPTFPMMQYGAFSQPNPQFGGYGQTYGRPSGF